MPIFFVLRRQVSTLCLNKVYTVKSEYKDAGIESASVILLLKHVKVSQWSKQ